VPRRRRSRPSSPRSGSATNERQSIGASNVFIALEPQLPQVFLRPDDVVSRHVDADDGQSWLVFTLTHSATAIGLVVALQTLPVLLLGPYGGVVADRVDKRKLMIILQSAMGVQAAILAVLSLTHVVNYVDVCILAMVLGLNNAFENPSRQSFVLEMVGPKDLRNASV